MPAINLTTTTYTQNFNTLESSGSPSSIMPTGWEFLESGTNNANNTYGIDDGTSPPGNTYSYGTGNTNDRALGGLRSNNLIPTLGVSFTNNTGSTIRSLAINYRGEQWRLGAVNRTDRLDFQYSLDATSLLSTGSWVDFNSLDFSSVVTTGPLGALNGNASQNSANLSGTISGLSIANGEKFYLRWQDLDVPGPDDGLAIDDFSLTPTLNLAPTNISLSPSNVDENVLANTLVGNFSSTDPDTGNTFTYSLVTDPNYPDNTAFTISNTGQLKTNAALDFETKPTYNILVRTTDAGGLSYDKPLTVNLNNVNEAPTNLSLSPSNVDENVLANTLVGNFSSTDPDTGNT
ncbi:cadherin repeat domain-containing protein, partial [Microcoleus sp. BR0-C5]|uniref:cadherin repeat domain-containing protein n=1 Tax=Microcoleus sp. BR0-C5 TaxID=2818713 RepID=UPI002FD38323